MTGKRFGPRKGAPDALLRFFLIVLVIITQMNGVTSDNRSVVVSMSRDEVISPLFTLATLIFLNWFKQMPQNSKIFFFFT